MDQETILFVIKMLSVTLVVLPWWLYRKLRGLPFDDGAPAPSGRYDAFARWALVIMWLLFAFISFLLGGVSGLLLLLGVIATMALVWALIWTPIQAVRSPLRSRGDIETEALTAVLQPFHRRFVSNFRTAVVELPARFLDGF